MITLYSTGFPKCRVIETKLNEKDIQYIKVTDVNEMTKLGFKSAPILEIDGKILNFGDAIRWIKNV